MRGLIQAFVFKFLTQFISTQNRYWFYFGWYWFYFGLEDTEMCAKGSRPARNDTTNETIVCADLTSLPPMNMNTFEAQMKNFGEGACPESSHVLRRFYAAFVVTSELKVGNIDAQVIRIK